MSNVGKNLKPTKLGLNVQVPIQIQAPTGIQSNLDHTQSDADSSPQSQHHTLGTARNQASPGDHNHDGTTSRKLGRYQMDPAGNKVIPKDVLAGAKGGNVALTNLIALLKNYIDFTDSTT